jgi:hypothetical protein
MINENPQLKFYHFPLFWLSIICIYFVLLKVVFLDKELDSFKDLKIHSFKKLPNLLSFLFVDPVNRCDQSSHFLSFNVIIFR